MWLNKDPGHPSFVNTTEGKQVPGLNVVEIAAKKRTGVMNLRLKKSPRNKLCGLNGTESLTTSLCELRSTSRGEFCYFPETPPETTNAIASELSILTGVTRPEGKINTEPAKLYDCGK